MDDLTQLREDIIRRAAKPLTVQPRFVPTEELERRVPMEIARKPAQTREIIERSIDDIGVDRTQRVLRGAGLTPGQIERLANQGEITIGGDVDLDALRRSRSFGCVHPGGVS
jgi:hypothetical protein